MSLRDFLKVLRQRWWVILLCTVIAGAIMWLVTPARTDTTQRVGSYKATATLLVEPAPVERPAGGSNRTAEPVPVQGTAQMGRIQILIQTGQVPIRAAARVGYTGDPALLANGLEVLGDPSSESITIAAMAADGERAALVANSFANEAISFFAEDPAGAPNTRLTMLQEATPIPIESGGGFVIPPDRSVRTAIAALLGVLFGLALALVLDRLDSRLRTRQEVHEALRMPVVAEVPRLGRNRRGAGRIEVVAQPLSVYADGYRAARSAITHMASLPVEGEWSEPTLSTRPSGADTAGARVVLVTSGHAGEGKTTSAANLAASFAETGKKVLVLDADLRSPDTHTFFDVPQGSGISDYLMDSAGGSIESMLRPTNVPGVRIMTAGTRLDYPASLTSRMAPLIEQARQSAEIVIVDCAPLLAASDVFDMLPLVDTIVLVTRSGRLSENAAHRVAELLGRFRVPVIGAILIGAPLRKADGYGAGYGYGQTGRRGAPDRRHAAVAPAPVEDTPPGDVAPQEFPAAPPPDAPRRAHQ